MFFKKKKEEAQSVEDRGIYVLGSGCKKCNQLEDNVKEALKKLGVEEEIHHITDFSVIASMGVMSTPALVVDGEVVSYGKLLSVEESAELLEKRK
ncbi:MAG: thioredoxin family protein [Peptoniphilus sp.]|uniref:thioredoxin family protein n=1 Tax=Peptoniphilus sp. TaxID=1971214 RepID=UPI002A752EB9|nr:thioredoxin family protein [Peptoniphilus sp.]MDY2986736.1 thioredoxin family protein [Peptoniphilus sp.]